MKHGRGRAALQIAGIMVAVLCATSAWSLTDEEIFRDFRFNFISPGARALGLGGAFIAAADDATAAEANPAALHYIGQFEAFVEYRSVESETGILQPSSPSVLDPFGPTFLDFNSVTKREDAELLSFASFAYPFKLGNRRGTLAVSRQIVLDAENSLSDGAQGTSLDISLSEFPIVVNPGNPPTVGRYLVRNDVVGMLDAELINYNLAFSISLTNHFSLGVTATMAELDMKTEVTSTTTDPRGVVSSVNPRLGVPGGLSDIQLRTAIDDDDSDVAYTVGLHWHPDGAFPNRGFLSPIRFGFVFRKGAELSVQETQSEFDPLTGAFPLVPDETFETTLRVPDRFGVGMSYEVGRHWLFAADIERIKYSDLLEGFKPGVNFFTSNSIPTTLLPIIPDDLVFDVDDATIGHIGAEFFIGSGKWNYAIRAGYFNAEDNRIRLVGIDTGDPEIDALMLDLFRGGEDQDHFTAGISVNTPAGIQLQLAGNFSDDEDEVLASMIWRFGKIRR